MKFFIDTANLDQIREANELGVLDGVFEPLDKIKSICALYAYSKRGSLEIMLCVKTAKMYQCIFCQHIRIH